jgi:protoporphyrinogen oxidase
MMGALLNAINPAGKLKKHLNTSIFSDVISAAPIGKLIPQLNPPVSEEALYAASDLKYRDFLIVALIVNERDAH